MTSKEEFLDERRIVSAEITMCCGDNNLYERLISSVRVPSSAIESVNVMDECVKIGAVTMSGAKSVLTPEILVKHFGCGLKTVHHTIEVTTQ